MTNFVADLVLGTAIANGHFGQVLNAADAAHGAVAVKVLRQFNGEDNADWVQRKETLLQEAQRLSQAEHDNVVRVYYLVRHDADDTLHLVMQKCDDSLLSAFENGPMSLVAVRRAATETMSGLQALHARGMLHRDIKPGNLLRKNGVTKIGDFGLVTDNLVLGYGSIAGYLDHLAPEVHNHGPTSVKTDIWALGMTVYRLLHGQQWYSELPSPPRIANGGFASSLPWLPHVPDGWRRVVRKMMHDDPAARYQSAVQLFPAFASLKCEPDWTCVCQPDQVLWSRQTKTRRFSVRWDRAPGKKNNWVAESFPIGNGIKRTLGSGKSLSKSDAIKTLSRFFAAST